MCNAFFLCTASGSGYGDWRSPTQDSAIQLPIYSRQCHTAIRVGRRSVDTDVLCILDRIREYDI